VAGLGGHGELDADQAAFLEELRARRGRLDGLYGTLVLHRPLAEMMLEIGRFYRTAATSLTTACARPRRWPCSDAAVR